MAKDLRDEAYRVEADAAVLIDWSLAPEHVRKIALAEQKDGVSTMVCIDDLLGWCVLCTAGQGPCFSYVENEGLLPK